MTETLLPTTVVGSYPQPDWLIDREKLTHLPPVRVRDGELLRRNTDRRIKITLPGPFTMSRQAHNEFYKDEEELVMDYAAAVNAELRELKAAGADVIQLDEPWVQARPEEARHLALS